MANPNILYQGNVVDRNDGSYLVTYSIPLAGNFLVSVRIGGEAVKYCIGPSGERCLLEDELYLNVIHFEQHGVITTLAEDEGLAGLSNAIVGVETGFLIKSRDKFGNLRSGSSTPHLDKSGDGMSDALLVSFTGPSGNTVVTSTAVEFLNCLDSIISGNFLLVVRRQSDRGYPTRLFCCCNAGCSIFDA